MKQVSTSKGTVYHVKWKGYDPTWEPYEHVRDCAAFRARWQQQQKQPASQPTATPTNQSRRQHQQPASQPTTSPTNHSRRSPLPSQCPLCAHTFTQGKGLVSHFKTSNTHPFLHISSTHTHSIAAHTADTIISHYRRCTAANPAQHSFRTQPQPIQHTCTSLAETTAATLPLEQEHLVKPDCSVTGCRIALCSYRSMMGWR